MVVESVSSVVRPNGSTGLIVVVLILGLLVGPCSCGMRAPATDALLLRPKRM